MQKICELKLVYVMIAFIWIIPPLINIPKRLEKNVEFSPGGGHEFGYVCYTKLVLNETDRKVVVFSKTQYLMNLINDSIILMIIVGIILVAWISFKTQFKARAESLKTNELQLLALNLHAQVEQRRMTIATSVGSSFYLFVRLPLYIFGYPSADMQSYVAPGVAAVLFVMQFCSHYLIHTIINPCYLAAFVDILKIIFPCFWKCRKRRNNEN